MRIVVTGGSGFIGSNVVDRLLAADHTVTVIDNMSTGRVEFLESAIDHPACTAVHADLLDAPAVVDVVAGHDAVIHLAANADVRFGWNHPRRDIEQNVVATQNVLEAMRTTGVRRVLFSSTGSVYGESTVFPTPEDAPFPIQTSLYGASKVSAEAVIAAYAEAGHLDATVFRFVSILGPRYSHGHVFDFVQQLREHPAHLAILGDGTQRKSYLHVDDCVAAIMNRLVATPKFEVLNLGVADSCTVAQSVSWITERLGLQPDLAFSGGARGWIGDNPFILLDASRMNACGWQPTTTIRAAVESTVDWLVQHPWVFEDRSAGPSALTFSTSSSPESHG